MRTLLAVVMAVSVVGVWAVVPSATSADTAPAGGGLHPYPLFPSTPVPGWPGVEVDAETTREKLADLGGGVATYGQPEFLAYPGSVEHVRIEMQRYVPPYPVYNEQTLRRNTILHETPPYAAQCVSWQEPVYYNPMYRERVATSQRRPEVQVYPWKPGSGPIRIELGKLRPSLYAVRPIAAAPTQKSVKPKKYAFIEMRVNDLPDDRRQMNAYILRAQMLDNFYALQEFYFHACDGRDYRIELTLLRQSEAELLLYNVDVHDRFGDCAGRRGKRRTTLVNVEERHRLWEDNRQKSPETQATSRTPQEQRAYDDLVWNHLLPPLNVHTAENIKLDQYDPKNFARDRIVPAPPQWAALMELPAVDRKNDPLGLSRRGPLVFKVEAGQKVYSHSRPKLLVAGPRDAGQGKDPGQDDTPVELAPGYYYDAAQMTEAYSSAAATFDRSQAKKRSGLNAWHQWGDRQAARDEAIKFIRLVYDWPAVRPSHNLNCIMGKSGLDRRFERRYQWHPDQSALLATYDALFEFIDGNQELAAAAGRYIPWVRTPDDLIRLIDTYLVQDYANDLMKYRYFYDHGQPSMMVRAVLVQDNPEITNPWMEFLWTRGWEYPQELAGLADNVVTSVGRDGATNVGSIFYAIGGQLATVELMEQYMKAGGNPKYDLTDPLRYPKLRATIDLPFESAPAGRQLLGVGDVGGPSQPYGRLVHLGHHRNIFAIGWRWTRQPKFAYELVNTFGRANETDVDWEEILAAARQTRDPYLTNHSRVLSDWGAYLAGGYEEDDFRFKREVTVRIGNGSGHAHDDTLDLRLFAHGLTMAGDLGMRVGYGKPGHSLSRMHNVVEVDGRNWASHAWVRNLFDAPGAPVMTVEAAPRWEHVKLFRRQVAMIDVDSGVRAKQQPPQLDPNVVTPSAYVFDVFRVSGGTLHTYCFHGCVDDGFDVNVKDRVVVPEPSGSAKDDKADAAEVKPMNPDQEYLRDFRWGRQFPDAKPEDKQWAANPTDDTLIATWRLSRGPEGSKQQPESRMISGLSGKHSGAMTEPRKYTRLHLFEQSGNRVLHGISMDRTLTKEHNPPIPYYAGRCLFAQRRGQEGQALNTVFVGLIEPYAGEPFITAARMLQVAGAGPDALRPVAVDVTTSNGHRDLCVADGSPGPVRSVAWEPAGPGGVKASAEFAYLSRDEHGLRQAVLSGGTMLETGEITIAAQRPAYESRVAAVDYLTRKVRLDGELPGRRWIGKFFEIGNPAHRTNYEISEVEREGDTPVLTLRKGLETMRSHVTAFDAEKGILTTTIAMLNFAGANRGLVATNDEGTKCWRVAYLGGNRHEGHRFQLSGASWRPQDFAPGTTLHVWEFGAGDIFRIATGVSLRRASGQTGGACYEVVATAPVTLTVPATSVSVSRDGRQWLPAKATIHQDRTVVALDEELIDRSPLYVKW